MPRLEARLRPTQAYPVRRRGRTSEFRVSGMRNWSPLTAVSRGRFQVVETDNGIRVEYELRFAELIGFSLFIPSFAVGAVLDL